MLIKILHRFTAAVLFEHDAEYNSMRITLELAVKNSADLRGADLGGAYLGGADLGGAYLGGANLRGANLRGADLRGAYLGGAYLGGANLRGADLRGAYLGNAYLGNADLGNADLRGADLRGAYLGNADLRGAYLGGAYLGGADLLPIKADFIEIISRAPREVPALIAALKEGRVDGSTYEGSCACLVGTIANVRGIDYREFSPDSSRPAERFFMAIKRGDTPETNEASKIALEWAQEWHATQLAAFAPPVAQETGDASPTLG